MRFFYKIFVCVFFLSLIFGTFFVFAQEKFIIHFFKSETCLHCAAEEKFLTEMEKKYPALEVLRYDIHLPDNQRLLEEMAKEYGAENYVGIVPLTFIGEDFFVGFDSADGVGRNIEIFIQKGIKNLEVGQGELPLISPADEKNNLWLPFLGNIDAGQYPFFVLAVLLGFLDGFNVCSLAALVLILGLVLVLKSRKKILLFGGTFIFTTSAVYGILIILWHQLFSFFAPYIRLLEILVAVLAFLGGLFFLRQFFLFRKYGPACSATAGDSLISRVFLRIQKVFETSSSTLVLLGSIFLFALAVTIIEFPCSAAIPVIFAGILAKAQLSFLSYFFYIAIFVLFYMFDEFIIFLIAVFKMNIWLTSPKFTIWITLIEAIILILMGLYYFVGII